MKFVADPKALEQLNAMPNRPKAFDATTQSRFINWIGYQPIGEERDEDGNPKQAYMNLLFSRGDKIGLPNSSRLKFQETLEACKIFHIPVVIYETSGTTLKFVDKNGVEVERTRRNFVLELPDGVDEQEMLAAYREAIKQ